MDGKPWLDPAACRQRQRRLLERLAPLDLDAVLVVLPEHVQYLTGPRWDWRFAPLVGLDAAGNALLVCPDRPAPLAAADEIVTYEAKWRSTLRMDQRQASAAAAAGWLAARGPLRRVGVEWSACPPHVGRMLGSAELVDIEPHLVEARRRKDPDELALLRQAIAATGEMYRAAREIVRPGVCELDVFSALQAAAVRSCGEMLTGTGNDYASGLRGGAPRPLDCRAGDLFILDLGPAFRGYFADNARTLAVDGRPTDRQLAAWEHVCGAFGIVERMARPGVRCRDIYAAVQEWLAAAPVGSWSSHLGHGIGLFVHEPPHLNPAWDDTLAEGEVIAVEPALYGEGLHCGIRLENDYLVTADGLELLSSFPLDLV
jgi:Xaa-Pro aminopeptidase